jgi:hypothetical protein
MKRLGIVLLAAFLPITAAAWSRPADERIARKGAELAPPDLRLVIDKFESDYKRGIERAAGDENESHQRTLLKQRIERETRGIITMIRGNEPMSVVVERLGGLAHLISDANNPFQVAAIDASMKSDYSRYFEQRLPKFPTVFYGLDAHFNLTPFLDKTFARTTKLAPLVSAEYARVPASSEFDDRSTAFGVAAVCYSRAVTDLVNVYYFIWRESGGDVRVAPAMAKSNLLVR